jgi:hypothetical protein
MPASLANLNIVPAEVVKAPSPADQQGFREDMQTPPLVPVAAEVLEALVASYMAMPNVNLETIFGALAAPTAEFALRAGLDAHGQVLPPGDRYVLGGAADPFLYKPGSNKPISVWAMVQHGAKEAGANVRKFPDMNEIVVRTTQAIGEGKAFPPIPRVPERNLPAEWSPNACVNHRDTVIAIAAKHGFTAPSDITMVLAIAMMLFFKQSGQMFKSGTVTPNIVATLIAEIMIATSRMAPLTKTM